MCFEHNVFWEVRYSAQGMQDPVKRKLRGDYDTMTQDSAAFCFHRGNGYGAGAFHFYLAHVQHAVLKDTPLLGAPLVCWSVWLRLRLHDAVWSTGCDEHTGI
jgi:hypothetical protein